MSLRNRVLTIALVAATGLVAGREMALKARTPASAPEDGKSALFRPHKATVSKPNQMLLVTIDPVGGFPATDDEVATLRATVKLERPVDGDLHIQWVLPEGARLVSGIPEEGLSLAEGEIAVREITVTGFSSEGMPRNVSLEVSATDRGVAVGAGGVISSHPTRSDLSIGFRKPGTGKVDDPAVRSKAEAAGDEVEERPAPPSGIRL